MAKAVVTSSEVIKDKEFSGGAPLTAEDWSIFVVEHFDDLGPIFLNEWQDTAGVLLTGELSADNAHIQNLNLVTVGKIFTKQPAVVAANRIWTFKEKDVYLRLDTIDLKKFKFSGKMYSEFLDSSDLAFKFIDENDMAVPLLPLVQQGFEGFSLRMVVAPDSTFLAKVYVYIYPKTAATMREKFEISVTYNVQIRSI